jgi:hypothetical protein
VPAAHAQVGAVAVSFRNELKIPVIIQGFTVVNGMPRAGMAMVVLPGKTAIDNNVPAGTIRFYRVVDANRPVLQYIRNLPVPVLQEDINLAIRGVPPRVFVKVVP